MKSKISVAYQLVSNPKQTIQIPVRYKVVDDAERCIKTVFCAIDLSEEELPTWLTPSRFEIVNEYHGDAHIIHYNDKEVDNIDAEFFRYKLYAEIMIRERLKEGAGMEHC